MDRFNWKKYLFIILVLVLGISIFYNINSYLNNKKKFSKIREINNINFLTLTTFGNQMANKLEKFVDVTNQKETSEIKSKLDDLWRIVIEQNNSFTNGVLMSISTQHVGDEARDWGLLQYSLIQVDEFLLSMTIKFLEQGSYTISFEEREILDAIISVYRIFGQVMENDTINLKDVLQSIQEPMIVIDHNYKDMLDRIENYK